jgi:hypothetical protein
MTSAAGAVGRPKEAKVHHRDSETQRHRDTESGSLDQWGVAAGSRQTQCPATIQGFNMPNRVVLGDAVAPNDKFEIAVFAINGPISAASADFLWFREAKIEFFR